ncbi:MAG: hypothetical protein HUU34_19545 [Saprospiraceae bacterium]|jgi:hypothetical protein|nr:hypothetical protein [Saprospiraceae bacterium]
MQHQLLIILLALIHAAANILPAQNAPERQSDFISKPEAAGVRFAPVLPPLIQIAGAPSAYYDYYWEFGDGTFDFEKDPLHYYADSSEHEVFFLATGKYDNGKAPRSRKKKTPPPREKPGGIASVVKGPNALPHESAPLGLKAVRNPRAGEEWVGIVAYANQSPIVQSGELYLFFNQREYKKGHFNFLESRTHYGEKELSGNLTWHAPLTFDAWAAALPGVSDWYAAMRPSQSPDEALSQLETEYASFKSWQFAGLQAGDLRHLFVSFEATPEMLADTHAIITMSALLVSDDQRVVERYDLEMEIVASHDPNYIAVSKRRMGFRRIRNKDLVYKVHFQNNGEGPASTVEITCDAPTGLNAAQMQVLDAYPQSLLCPSQTVEWSCLDTTFQDNKLVFTFRNIYLPGTRQEGVSDRDSTKGFVKFRLLPDKKIKKQAFASRASIVFDKNPPIRTNSAGTAFKAGFSPGVMLGGNFFPSDSGLNQYFVGLVAAPFKPYRHFLQWEAMFRFRVATIEFSGEIDTFPPRPYTLIENTGDVQFRIVDSIKTIGHIDNRSTLLLSLVPLQLRKNWTGWLSTGVGLMLNIEFISTKTRDNENIRRIEYRSPEPELNAPREFWFPLFEDTQDFINTETEKSVMVRPALFADIHLGMVRKGPALGIRPVLRLAQKPAFYVSVFTYWKF